jgi:hypothetical protein
LPALVNMTTAGSFAGIGADKVASEVFVFEGTDKTKRHFGSIENE